VLRNIVKPRGHWSMLRVVDRGRDAIGAEIAMTVGQRTVHRDVRAAYSYLASNDPRVHVGLGSETAARNVTVKWVDGSREAFGDVQADRVVILERGKGKP
jgi:hypothetical protein